MGNVVHLCTFHWPAAKCLPAHTQPYDCAYNVYNHLWYALNAYMHLAFCCLLSVGRISQNVRINWSINFVFSTMSYHLPCESHLAQRWVHSMLVCTVSTSCCCLIKAGIPRSTDVVQTLMYKWSPSVTTPTSTQDKRPEPQTLAERNLKQPDHNRQALWPLCSFWTMWCIQTGFRL